MSPQQRRQTILTLLDHWPEFFDTAGGTRAVTAGDTGGGLPLLSSMAAHPSVVELGRCLVWLRANGRAHYAATLGFFGAPWRTTDRPVRRRDVRGRMIDDIARVRERVLPRELTRYPRCQCGCGMPRPVCLAVDVLGGTWDRGVPLELPRPLLAKLRPLADADGWTEAA